MVLTGSISKSECFSDILCIAVCTGVNCWGFSGNKEYFSVINLDLWSCLLYCLTVFNFATVNLSDFSHSVLISAIICRETISLFRLLGCCWGHIVGVFAAVGVLVLLAGNLALVWVVYHIFSLLAWCLMSLSSECKDFPPIENMNVLCNLV